jgi:hypothetical protein
MRNGSGKAKLPRPLEKSIQKGAIDLLDFYGVEAFRRNTGAMKASHKGRSRLIRFANPGASDLWGVHRETGIHWEVEIKRPEERPRLDQVEWLLRHHRLGAVAFWVDNLDTLDSILFHLEAHGCGIAYLPTTRVYRVKDRDIGWTSIEGPSGDFDLFRRTPGGISRCRVS